MRYIPTTQEERERMLAALGIQSLEELFQAIPSHIRSDPSRVLPEPLAESQLLRHMQELASQNQDTQALVSFMGAGAYDHLIPAVVNHVTQRGEFLTAYTPYQAEISQGVLQAIFEFQTLIAELTGMDAANASMYDGATALAEACLMACNAARRQKVVLPATLHPEWIDVVKLYLESQDIHVEILPFDGEAGTVDLTALTDDLGSDAACVVAPYPNFFGLLEPVEELSQWIHDRKGLFVMAVDPVAMGLLQSPGAVGADIVVGDGQPLGNAMAYGGPSFGFFACRGTKLVRRMPGRIVGQTQDLDGKRGFVLTMQTREQHIRREKATSNICSNQALNALAGAVHLCVLGPEGLREAAYQCLQKATYLKQCLKDIGIKTAFSAPSFREFVAAADVNWAEVNKRLLEYGFLGGLPLGQYHEDLDSCVLLSVTEARTKEEIDRFVHVLGGLC